jgi:hypothetical protein
MIKPSVNLQELRRRIYRRAKADGQITPYDEGLRKAG